MEFAQRMRLVRRRGGLSQSQLAKKVGVQRSAVGHWESTVGNYPTVENMQLVATLTGVRFEWLATGQGAMLEVSNNSLDSVPAVSGMLIYDDLEIRLIEMFRLIPVRSQRAFVELAESMKRNNGRLGSIR